MKKEIKIFIDNQEIEFYELDDYLKNINCTYKEDGKWFIEYKEEDKKIGKIFYAIKNEDDNKKLLYKAVDKINEIIDKLNKINIVLEPTNIDIDKCGKVDYIQEKE